jgi:nucleolar protein 6
MAAEKKLSKREKKADAFKKRAKKPQFSEEMAVPASDEISENPVIEEKKTKAEPINDTAAAAAAAAPKRKAGESIDVPVEGSTDAPYKKKNRRSKKSSNMEGSRYIVFVGKKK